MIINNDVLIGLIRKTVDGGLSLRLNVRGFSMAPFIKDRDMVTIKKFGGRAHIWGTPAVYIHRCGKLVVHRVVGMRGKYYMLKADNSLAPDGYIPQEDLLGRVVRIERGNVDVIKDGGTYLTHCHSSTVISLFVKAWKDGKRFHLYVTETRPKFQGRKTAKELIEAGIDDITFIIDDVAAQLIASKERSIDAVFIGADMLSTEGLVNKIGSFGLSMACQVGNIPLYTVTTLLKYDPRTFSSSYIEKRASSEIWEDPPPELHFYTPAFDYIPYETYIKIICEKGEIRGDKVTSTAYSLYPFLTRS